MPIPKYDEIMLPLLRLLSDGKEHHQQDLASQIADQKWMHHKRLMIPIRKQFGRSLKADHLAAMGEIA